MHLTDEADLDGYQRVKRKLQPIGNIKRIKRAGSITLDYPVIFRL